MDRIDKYINSIYRDVDTSSKETEDLKHEMKSHLMQTVNELQQSGKCEDECIRVAIERFGEELQIRKELNQVLSFHKSFAKKTLVTSAILLVFSVVLLVTSYIVKKESFERYNFMDAQIKLVESKLVSGGINEVDTYLKEIFKDLKNNQLTYVAIKELPQDYDRTKNSDLFPGETRYSYPEKIERDYYNNRFGLEVIANRTRYLLETGVKTSANGDASYTYKNIGILLFVISWVLSIVWLILNVYRHGSLNTGWCVLFILTGVVGYFIFLMLNRKVTLSSL